MKNIIVVIGWLAFMTGESLNGAGRTYSELLSISFDAPSIRGFVSDSLSRRAGTDPSVGMDSVGEQKIAGKYYALKEIPNSGVTQDNNDASQSATGWTIYLEDPSGSYLLNYSSELAESAQGIAVDLQSYSPKKLFPTQVFLLAQKTATKQLKITASSTGVTAVPVFNNGDFLRDTQSACNLKDIAPEAACDVLKALASTVEKAITEGNTDKELHSLELYLRILNRLHNWSQKDSRHDWDDLKGHSECDGLRKHGDDDKFFAKDPAYSALKLDAETLLKALPPDKDHGHGGNNSQGKIR
jgi:hypothetical protein